MNTCETCKHWEQARECETGHSQGLGVCGAAKMLWDCTEWREDADDRVFKDEFQNHKAFVQDGSDYSARLLTKPDFGCVQHVSSNASLTRGEAVALKR